MKNITIGSVILMVCFSMVMLGAGQKDMTSIFPTLDGWTKKGKPQVFTPDNLFEYINGAAEVFLSYDFEKLATLTYENVKKNSFTVDVYRHSSDRNGFGIYSQEKPQTGDFLVVGAQGYYEQGILNFFKGSYYVKMSGYDLGDNDKAVLTAAAKKIAAQLEGTQGFPDVLKCFPPEGKIPNSQGYINKNFLGHSFLHFAYVTDYQLKGEKVRVFIIESNDNTGVEKILESYLAFIKKKGMKVEENKNVYRFQDPYYRSSGMMNLKIKNNYLWGLFSKENATADFYIDQIEKNLKKKKLLD